MGGSKRVSAFPVESVMLNSANAAGTNTGFCTFAEGPALPTTNVAAKPPPGIAATTAAGSVVAVEALATVIAPVVGTVAPVTGSVTLTPAGTVTAAAGTLMVAP